MSFRDFRGFRGNRSGGDVAAPRMTDTRPLTPHGCRADITAHDTHKRMSERGTVKRVPKPWGHETIWAHTEAYVGKILHINAGEALSVQYHELKDETVYLLSGELIYRIWENDRKTSRSRLAKPTVLPREPYTRWKL